MGAALPEALGENARAEAREYATSQHLKIENRLHYRRDVTLREDRTRFSRHSAAHVMAVIYNLILDPLPHSKHRYLPSTRRFYATHLDAALKLITLL